MIRVFEVFDYIDQQIFIHNLLAYDDITIIYRPIVVKMASAYEKQNEEENMDDNFSNYPLKYN